MLRRFLLIVLFIHSGFAKTEPIEHENKVTASDVIAFSAELSSRTDLTGGNIIVFDRVRANEGGRYLETSGQFTCADGGLYVFMWSLRMNHLDDFPGMRCIAKLRKGGDDYKYGPKTDYYVADFSGACQMTAVLQCSGATAITVMTVPWSSQPGSVSRFTETETSFTGLRLQSTIAFTVKPVEDQTVSDSGRLRFRQVVANFGDHFDLTNDFFRCPDNGVYVFSVTTHTPSASTPSWTVSRLMMDEEVIHQGPITYIATEDYDSGSASITAVRQCKLGSSVYVEAQSSYNFPQNSYGSDLTSFSGFKLFDVVPEAVAFTAITSTNQTGSAGQSLIYGNVITNIGNAFDASLNSFVCPDDDFYLLAWTGTVDKAGDLTTHLRLHMDDTSTKFLSLTRQFTSDGDGTTGTCSTSTISKCELGRRYQVRIGEDVEGRVFIGGYSSFSGYKVPGDWAKTSN